MNELRNQAVAAEARQGGGADAPVTGKCPRTGIPARVCTCSLHTSPDGPQGQPEYVAALADARDHLTRAAAALRAAAAMHAPTASRVGDMHAAIVDHINDLKEYCQ